MMAFKHHFSDLISLLILDMNHRGEDRCCGLLYIMCKAHQHHRCPLAVLWLRLKARVSIVSIKTFWACCWKLRYEIKNSENEEITTIRYVLTEVVVGHFIIVYKSLHQCQDKILAFSCGFMGDRKMSPKKLVAKKKKEITLVWPPPPPPLAILVTPWKMLEKATPL